VSNECIVDAVETGPGDTALVARTEGPEAATVIWLLPDDGGGP
jgi:hypothetical protein